MDETLYKLLAWLSPAYPVGGFTFSHGLESAVETGDVRDRDTLIDWIADILMYGAGRTDGMLLACAYHAGRAGDAAGLAEVAELAVALAPSTERRLETTTLGAAFAETTSAAWGTDASPAPYPVTFGQAAARHAIPLPTVLASYLQALAATLVSAGIRLRVLGPTDGQRAVAALMPVCAQITAQSLASGLDEIGGCAIRGDIASMRHETQTTRLFRS